MHRKKLSSSSSNKSAAAAVPLHTCKHTPPHDGHKEKRRIWGIRSRLDASKGSGTATKCQRQLPKMKTKEKSLYACTSSDHIIGNLPLRGCCVLRHGSVREWNVIRGDKIATVPLDLFALLAKSERPSVGLSGWLVRPQKILIRLPLYTKSNEQ